jgi:hypothetical protein
MEPAGDPRYAANPMLLFLEAVILDVIGHLGEGDRAKIEKMDIKKTFGTRAAEWRMAIREVLQLSTTFDTAVLDLWDRTSARASRRGPQYSPRQFARDFADQYLAPQSQVDVWTEETLRAAQQRTGRRR